MKFGDEADIEGYWWRQCLWRLSWVETTSSPLRCVELVVEALVQQLVEEELVA